MKLSGILALSWEILDFIWLKKVLVGFAVAGTTVSPPIVSICLHPMWSMGQVKEHYLYNEKVGNQYLGKTHAGTQFGLRF